MELQQLVDLAGVGGPENPWSSVGHETTVFGDHMGHADNRTYLDADSHIMELPDFLTSNAPQSQLALVPRVPVEGGARSADGFELAMEVRAQPADKVEEMIALGDQLISGPKGYFAPGAFNNTERTQALDQLGFHRQLVFSTFAAPMCFNADSIQARYASAAAHNRGIAEFCADDDRLMGVGALPLNDSAAATAEIEHLIDGRLERALDGHTAQALDRFYADNFSRVFGSQA